MPADLEAQLRASLPGRETAVQDYASLHVALNKLQLASSLLGESAALIRIAVGTRGSSVNADEARLATLKAISDLDRTIKNHPAGKVPR